MQKTVRNTGTIEVYVQAAVVIKLKKLSLLLKCSVLEKSRLTRCFSFTVRSFISKIAISPERQHCQTTE